MEAIYNEMYIRNTNWLQNNPVIADPLLLDPESDRRRCIALVARHKVEFVDTKELQPICEPLSQYWISPVRHHTFIVLRGWSEDEFPKEDWTLVKKIISDNLSPYEITFDRVIPVKTGLTLCGRTTMDVNNIRDQIRDAGYETFVLYKCDIIHTTILRWTHVLPSDIQEEWLQHIMKLPEKPYLKIRVTGFDIVLASWSMHPNTIEILDSIDL